jgi:hypothetical protein
MGKRLKTDNGLSTQRDLNRKTVSNRCWVEYRERFKLENG